MMAISVFDIFKIGIGPSSSHTVGPMRAAFTFASDLKQQRLLAKIKRIDVDLFGSLGATGKGHGTDKAVLMGLEGELPDQIDPAGIAGRIAAIRNSGKILLLKQYPVSFHEAENMIFHRKALPFHANGMRFTALDVTGAMLLQKEYYSVGGGFVVSEENAAAEWFNDYETRLPHPFKSADELLKICASHDLSFSGIMLRNEQLWCSESELRQKLWHIWEVMQDCVQRGCHTQGVLPGGMKVRRRAASIIQQLENEKNDLQTGAPLGTLDW